MIESGKSRSRMRALCATVIAAGIVAVTPAAASAAGSFYEYDGATPLGEIEHGTPLKTRTVQYRIGDLYTPFKAVQILYRSTGSLGQPTTNVTSILLPLWEGGNRRLVAYGSFYDSLDPRDQPSNAISGLSNTTLGGALANVEGLMILPLLTDGYTVAVTDTEGQEADFAAGPVYGRNTLDALRAAYAVPETRLRDDTKGVLIGYSGGAIATEWAAELAPTYTPDVNRRLIGASMGGVLVNPSHNLHYINGSKVWAGVMPMALIGIARSFQIDLEPYMSDYGRHLFKKLEHASIVDALFQYPGLTWQKLAKPEYESPESVGLYVRTANKLIMSTGGTPSMPLHIVQGSSRDAEGTIGDKDGIGPGDGVMVAGDVRALAREYCSRGVTVQYQQYDGLTHITTSPPWRESMASWIADRFAGRPVPQNCADIAPGNSLEPMVDPDATPEQPSSQEPAPSSGPPAPPVIPELPPAAAPKTTATAPAAPGASVKAKSTKTKRGRATVTRVRVRRGAIVLTQRCAGSAGQRCTVSYRLTVRTRAGRRLVAVRRVKQAAGRSGQVTIRLNARGRALLRTGGRLRVSLTATQVAGRRVARATVTVR